MSRNRSYTNLAEPAHRILSFIECNTAVANTERKLKQLHLKADRTVLLVATGNNRSRQQSLCTSTVISPRVHHSRCSVDTMKSCDIHIRTATCGKARQARWCYKIEHNSTCFDTNYFLLNDACDVCGATRSSQALKKKTSQTVQIVDIVQSRPCHAYNTEA